MELWIHDPPPLPYFQLCHPRALRFQTQQEPRDPAFHSFIITKEDGSRVYGAVLTYYEVVCEPQISKAMQTLQSMHMAELSNTQSRTLYSHLSENSTEVHKRSPMPGKKKAERTFSIERDTLYCTKCLCLLSQIPLIRTFERILVYLYNAIMSVDQPDLPFESHIFNLLFEVPMPPAGKSVGFTVMGNSINCQRPGILKFVSPIIIALNGTNGPRSDGNAPLGLPIAPDVSAAQH